MPAMSAAAATAAEPPRPRRFVETSALSGFGPAMGVTIAYLSFFLLLPLAALIVRPWEHGFEHFRAVMTDPRTVDALKLSFGASFVAACINAVFGTIAAWVLVRYEFPGRRVLDALVDLPFALPTAVAGISLAAIYAPNGIIGQFFPDVQIAYSPLGVLIALVFVGFPFIVRSIQPVLEDLDVDAEEAAATLGAGRVSTIIKVVLPAILPALLAGFSLAFARAVGEYGSVIFIAGNIPNVSEIAPLLIVIRLEEFDYAGAASVGLVMLTASFVMLLILNALQGAIQRRGRA
jgi:sulfate/thiosulfate transport system permease protein